MRFVPPARRSRARAIAFLPPLPDSAPAILAALGLAALALSLVPRAGHAQGPHLGPPPAASKTPALDDTSRVRRWREDLRFVTERVTSVHPKPFAFTPRAAFDSAAAEIGQRIAQMEDARVAIEMMRMVALLGDGHTLLIGTFPPLGFTSLCPVLLRPFEDGLYVAAAAPGYARAVGARVTRIGTLPAGEALDRVLTIVSGDNRYTRLDRAPLFMMSPLALHALGICEERDRIPLEIEGAGGKRERVVALGGAPPEGFPEAFNESEPRLPAGWISARGAPGAELPRCDRRPDEAWWTEYLPAERVLYLRLRRVEPASGDRTFAGFLKATFALADSLRPAALVVDLRHDHGGNNTILDPMIHGIIARPWLDRDGALFTLTDRGTFSAAMNAAVFLEEHTHTEFAGEPTGGRVNHYGDAREATSPNHGLLLMVSQWPWQARLPWDDRPWIAPQLAVPATFAAWRDRRDPALEQVLDAVAHGTLQGRVFEAARTGGAAAADAACEAWERAHPNPWRASIEPDLDALTARLLDDGAPEALAVADARTRRFTRSSQAWRRLGEAALDAGDRATAVASLRRALALNPESRAARFMLERLGEKP